MRQLIINGKAKEAIDKVIQYAENNRVPKFKMIECVDTCTPSTGIDNVCFLVDGFRVAYSIEQLDKTNDDWYRHISISIDKPDKAPSIEQVECILQEFGFESDINKQANIWLEKINAINENGPYPAIAVNIIAKYDELN